MTCFGRLAEPCRIYTTAVLHAQACSVDRLHGSYDGHTTSQMLHQIDDECREHDDDDDDDDDDDPAFRLPDPLHDTEDDPLQQPRGSFDLWCGG